MSEENVVRLCAPTLAGIKTGSLFPCPYECRETLLTEIRRYNQVLVPKGLCLLPLRFTEKSAISLYTKNMRIRLLILQYRWTLPGVGGILNSLKC